MGIIRTQKLHRGMEAVHFQIFGFFFFLCQSNLCKQFLKQKSYDDCDMMTTCKRRLVAVCVATMLVVLMEAVVFMRFGFMQLKEVTRDTERAGRSRSANKTTITGEVVPPMEDNQTTVRNENKAITTGPAAVAAVAASMEMAKKETPNFPSPGTTSHSSDIMFIFAIGLEGTGHHFYGSVVKVSPALRQLQSRLNTFRIRSKSNLPCGIKKISPVYGISKHV